MAGNSGRYFKVRNCDSEYGLSSRQVCGREWDLVTPRSASRNATGLEAIDEPLSAWMVNMSRSMPCLAMVSANSCSARAADSRSAISHLAEHARHVAARARVAAQTARTQSEDTQ